MYAADALNVIAAAIEATGSTDSTVLTEYIRNELHINGITGPVSFGSTRDRAGAIYKAYGVVDRQPVGKQRGSARRCSFVRPPLFGSERSRVVAKIDMFVEQLVNGLTLDPSTRSLP